MQKKANSIYVKRRIIALIFVAVLVALIIFLANKNKIIKNNQFAKSKFDITVENTIIQTNAITDIPNAPVLGAGMIPIKYDENNNKWVITETTDSDWYNYSSGKMATVMLSDGYYKSELDVGVDQDRQLSKNNIGTSINTQLGTIYVWVPRIVFIGDKDYGYLDGTSIVEMNEYTLPSCFKYDPTSSYEIEFTGIWVEQTPQTNQTETTTKITNMNKENNEYGLIKNELVEVCSSTAKSAVTRVQAKKAKTLQQVQDITNRNRSTIKIINTDSRVPIIASTQVVGKTVYINVDYNEYAIDKIVRCDTGDVISTGSTTAEVTVLQDGTYEFAISDVEGNIVYVTTPRIGVETPDFLGFRVDTTYLVMYTEKQTLKADGTTEVTYTEVSDVPLKDILKKGYKIDDINALTYGNIDFNKLHAIEQEKDAKWYDYEEQKWANIVARNNASEIYYTWIPRYVYKLNNAEQYTYIKFVTIDNLDSEGNPVDLAEWILPEAFTWGDEVNPADREQIPGFWATKYELSQEFKFNLKANIVGGIEKIQISNITNESTLPNVTYDVYLYKSQMYGEDLDKNKPSSEFLVRQVENIVSKYTFRYVTSGEYEFSDLEEDDYEIRIVLKDKNGLYRGEQWFSTNVMNKRTAELPDLVGYRVNTTYIVVYDKDNNETSNIPISEILRDGYVVDEKTNTLKIGKVDENKVRNKLKDIDGAVWYDYDNHKWANIVARNNANEIYYTWIPRYVYRLDTVAQISDILFIGPNDKTPVGWTLPEAFTWGDETNVADRAQLPGFWASKYELSGETTFNITADVIGGTNQIKISSLSDGNSTNLGFNYRFYLYENDDVNDELKKYFTEPEQEMSAEDKANGNDCSSKKYVRYTEVSSENTTANPTNVIYKGLFSGVYDLRIVAYDSRGYYRGEKWYNDIVVEDITTAQIPDLVGYRVNTTYIVVYDKDNKETSNIPISEILSDGYVVDDKTNTLKIGTVDENKVRERIKGIDGAVWYDYDSQKWANIVVRNDSSEIYYTWIPRYIYRLDNPRQESEIKFIGVDDVVPTGWTLPEAFTWGDDTNPANRTQLPGFWASKYELSSQTTFNITADVIGGTNKIKISSLSDGNNTNLGFKYRFYLYENDNVDDELKKYFTEPEQEMTEAEKQDNNNCSAKKYVRYTELSSENTSANPTNVIYTGLFAGLYDLRIVAYDSRGYYRAEKWYNDIVVEEKTQANEPELMGFNPDCTYYVVYNSQSPTDTTETKISENDPPEGWYDYDNQKWANIVVKADGKTSYFVWIPRYIYKLDTPRQETEIKFIGVDDEVPTGWVLPEAFTWGDDTDPTKRAQLSGFWATKYELSN